MQVADDEVYLVVNAGCREKDLNHISKHLDKFTVRAALAPRFAEGISQQRQLVRENVEQQAAL